VAAAGSPVRMAGSVESAGSAGSRVRVAQVASPLRAAGAAGTRVVARTEAVIGRAEKIRIAALRLEVLIAKMTAPSLRFARVAGAVRMVPIERVVSPLRAAGAKPPVVRVSAPVQTAAAVARVV
jgi:hypothetical protein